MALGPAARGPTGRPLGQGQRQGNGPARLTSDKVMSPGAAMMNRTPIFSCGRAPIAALIAYRRKQERLWSQGGLVCQVADSTAPVSRTLLGVRSFVR